MRLHVYYSRLFFPALGSVWLGLCLCGFGQPVETPMPSLDVEALFELHMGARDGADFLGFGWSHYERGDRSYRWMQHLEADVFFDLEETANAVLWLEAAPKYLNWKQQRIGLYMNGRFIGQRDLPMGPDFAVYQFAVPEEALRTGKNRLILRAGYRVEPASRDSRELSVAVSRIVLMAAESDAWPLP